MVRYLGLTFFGLMFLIGCQAPPRKVTGRIVAAAKPLAAVVVYAYDTPLTELKEEYVAQSKPSAEDGSFALTLETGSYYLVARKRQNKEITGPLIIGDYEGEYEHNPLKVKRGTSSIGDLEVTMITADRSSTLRADAGCIKGRVTGKNLDLAYVYVYPDLADKRGPAYEVAKPLEADGSFSVAVNPGKYQVLIRSHQSGKVRGPVAKDDRVGEAINNPVKVTAGQTTTIPAITLKTPDSVTWEDVHNGKIQKQTETVIQGKVVDNDRRPVAKVFAFLYAENQAVGKPLARSSFTAADGRFTIYLSEGGTFYLGARSSLGGPLEPGDWVGAYAADPKNLITLKTGEKLRDLLIVVETFRE